MENNMTYGPYSPAIRGGDYIFVSGQIGFSDSKTGSDLEGIEAQTKHCFKNMNAVLASVGASLRDVVKVTVFLRNIDDFDKMNEVYASYFLDRKPARSTIITGLINPKMLSEIECLAYCPIK